MPLFKKNVPRDIEVERREAASEEKEEPELPNSIGSANENFSVEIERLKAKMESLEEFNKSTAERFSAFNQEIGELREAAIERDKKIAELEAKALRAIDLVGEIDPQKILEVTQKTDFKIQNIEEKINTNKAFMENVMSEFKQIRADTQVFRDTKELMAMDKEVKKELLNVQKIKAMVDAHAAKVEDIFIEVEKNFNEMQQMKSLVNDMKDAVSKMIDDSNKANIKMATLADKASLHELKKQIADLEYASQDEKRKITDAVHTVNSLKRSAEASIHEAAPQIFMQLEKLSERIAAHEKELTSSHSFMESLLEEIKALGETITENNAGASGYSSGYNQDKVNYGKEEGEGQGMMQDEGINKTAPQDARQSRHPQGAIITELDRQPEEKEGSEAHQKPVADHVHQLRGYINSRLDKGVKPRQILYSLKAAGWPEHYVNEHIKANVWRRNARKGN